MVERAQWAARDHWLEDWAREAILDVHDVHPLIGYRRLTYMMIDADVVTAWPTAVYRMMKVSERLDK